MEKPKDRLRQARSKWYDSPTDAAKAIKEINVNTLTSNENGNRNISRKMAKLYSKHFDVPAGWILYGEHPTPPSTPHPSIPRYDIRLSAGAGAVNYEDAEILDRIPFTDEFLVQKLNRTKTEGLICCYVHGDSMAPTLNDGDLVILDVEQVRDRRPAGIYAITYGRESFVKRVEKVDTGYTLFSDNPAYETIRIRGDEVSKLRFIGKVIWSGGVMR